jgi:hypothetical protein
MNIKILLLVAILVCGVALVIRFTPSGIQASEQKKILDNIKTSWFTEDPKNYRVFDGHIPQESRMITSELVLFPKEVSGAGEIEKYYYYCGSSEDKYYYSIYLVRTMSTADLADEISRLNSIQVIRDNEKHVPFKANTGFRYPAIIAISDNVSKTFEVAWINRKDNQIAYYYSQGFGMDRFVLDEEYLPEGYAQFTSKSWAELDWIGVNIYSSL